MALVHSRIGRVIFCYDSVEGGLGGGGPDTSIHSLPSTNHRYRAFRLVQEKDNEIFIQCEKLKELSNPTS